MINTLPISISKNLLKFCQSVAPGRPVFVRSKPSNDAKPHHCLDNVNLKIERAGGSSVLGWAIWHLPGAYLEAEHHVVWRKRSGELVDVSPQANGYRKILFLPDPDALFENGMSQASHIEADGDDPDALELVSSRVAYNDFLIARRRGIVDEAKVNQLLGRTQELLAKFI